MSIRQQHISFFYMVTDKRITYAIEDVIDIILYNLTKDKCLRKRVMILRLFKKRIRVQYTVK